MPEALKYTETFSYNDLDGTIRAIKAAGSDLAGVIIEGVGQLFIPPEIGYLNAVFEETKKAGALFILDEVITGLRFSLQGAQGRFGIKPDLCTMGKVLGGGMNMLNKGIYTVYGGGAISTAHTDEDLDKIINAAGETAREMAAE